jgi:hypothetical protein
MANDPIPTPHLRTSKSLVLALIAKIASAANVKLGEGTLAVYLERLICLSPERLETATNRTIDGWRVPGVMPPLPFIVDRSYLRAEGDETANDAARILTTEHLLSAARDRVTHDQVQEWVSLGKQTQEEYIARLASDAEWQYLFEKFGRPGLQKRQSSVPSEPDERKTWARDTAKKQGWQ